MLSDISSAIGEAVHGIFRGKGEEEASLREAVKKITMSLLSSNVNAKIVLEMRKRIMERYKELRPANREKKEKLLKKIVFEELSRIISTEKKAFQPEKESISVVLFVGLQGSGKTTTCCKYARYYKHRGYKAGIVCADTFRAGAYEQVQQNVRSLSIPVYISSSLDPAVVAKEGVEELKKQGCNLILIDTSGRHAQEGELFREMEEIVDAVTPTAVIFVVDASIGQAAERHARGFMERVSVGSVIITKTDGTKNIGGALSSVAGTGTPVAFIGTGEGMIHLEPFSANSFVCKLMGIGDISGLVDKLESLSTQKDQEELIGKIKSGEFSMGDFYEQYKKILELGPISQLLSLVPGVNSSMLDEKGFRKMGNILSGMTRKELNTNGEVFIRSVQRIIRVADGCGVSPSEVREVVLSYRSMSQMLKKVTSNPLFAGILGGGERAQPSPESAQAQMEQLKRMMPPGFSSFFDQFKM